MKIQHKDDGRKGIFFMKDGDKQVGLMHYTYAGPGKFIIDHTEVNEAYEGRGLGRQLIKASVAFAREHRLKIIPDCPFAKKVFDVIPELADVLFN